VCSADVTCSRGRTIEIILQGSLAAFCGGGPAGGGGKTLASPLTSVIFSPGQTSRRRCHGKVSSARPTSSISPEEIESLRRTEKQELIRPHVLMLYLIKWRYQPELRGPSWWATIRLQCHDLNSHLGDNPSLKALVPEAVEQAYGGALIEAEPETGLPKSIFPAACPWSFEEMMADDFWPEGKA
jgi:hypothetical protein